MESRFSSFSTSSTYSHLLYLNDQDRDNYLSSPVSPRLPRESTSYFSITSSRTSSESERSDFSLISSQSTRLSSVHSATIPTWKYADTHYPLITSLEPSLQTHTSGSSDGQYALVFRRQLAAMHNTIIRAINSAYNHAINIKSSTSQCEDFLQYAQVVSDMLDRQVEVEDTCLFPAFKELPQQPDTARSSITSDKMLMNGLHEFQMYIFKPTTVDEFDGVYFRRLVESFAPYLIQHLHDSIPTLHSLSTTSSSRLKKIWAHAQRQFIRGIDLHILGPFVLGCQDKNFLIDGLKVVEFPGVPWLVETMIKMWHAKKFAHVWNFCPSDLSGARRMILV